MKQITCPISLLAGQTGCLGSVCGWYSTEAKNERCLILAMQATVIKQQELYDVLCDSVDTIADELKKLSETCDTSIAKHLEPLEKSVNTCLEIISRDQGQQRRVGEIIDHRKRLDR